MVIKMNNECEINDETLAVEKDFASLLISDSNKRRFAVAIVDLFSGVLGKVSIKNNRKCLDIVIGDSSFKRTKGGILISIDDNQMKDILYISCSVALERKVNSNHRDYHFYSGGRSSETFSFSLKVDDGMFKFDEAASDTEFDRIASGLRKSRH